MTELSLIFGLVTGALLFTGGLLRWLLSLESGGAEARRLLGAVQRASASISWRQAKRGAAVTGVLLAVALVIGPLRGEPVMARGGWLGLGLFTGSLFSAGLSQSFLLIVTRGATRAASAMHGPVSHSVTIGLRTGAILSLLSEVASLLLASLALLPLFAEGDIQSMHLLLGGLTLGTLAPALLTQASSGAVYFSGQTGRKEPLFRAARYSYQLDAKNPTMVLDVVGTHLGQSVVRGQTAFCGSLLINVAALLAVLELDSAGISELVVLLGLPLVIRAVGLVACGFAVLATRVDEADDIVSALFRGQLSSAVLGLSAVWGATYWYLGDAGFVPFAVIGSVGVLGSVFISFAARIGLERRSAVLRELRETAKLSPPLSFAASVAAALRRSLGPLLGMLLSLCFGLYVAKVAQAAPGLSLGLLLACFFAGGGYAATLSNFDTLMASACGLASMDEYHKRPEFQSKVSSLHVAAQRAGGIGQSHAITGSALSGFAVAWLSWPHVLSSEASATTLLTFLGGLCGTALVLGYCGLVLGHVADTAKGLKVELQRQLRGFARDGAGYLELPASFRPRYKDHLDHVGESSVNRAELLVAAAVVGPLTLGLSLTWANGRETAQADLALLIMAFVGFATLTGFCMSLLTSGTTSTWGCSVRGVREDAAEPAKSRSLVESGVNLAEVATPLVQLVVASAAAAGIVLPAVLF